MLNRDRLQLAIDVQARSYQLLRWIAGAMEKGLVPVSRAKNHSNTPEAAVEWISSHYLLFPYDMQPDRSHLREFGNFFWTYLDSSFDVIDRPGTRLEADRGGCLCPLCAKIINAPHLQSKKLKAIDKHRASELMIDRISFLAREEHLQAPSERCREIAEDPTTRRSAAFSAYGYWLINRLEGETDGPSILALWREIAWRKTGAPIAGFRLRYEDVEAAEQLLVSALQECGD